MAMILLHEALISPVLPSETPGQTVVQVIVRRDNADGTDTLFVSQLQETSAQEAGYQRDKLKAILRTAYGPDRVTTISAVPQWERTRRFINLGRCAGVKIDDLPMYDAAQGAVMNKWARL